MTERAERKNGPSENTVPYRNEFRQDRDRILYSSALRRLAGVTQVASAVEGTIFHNRLTHSFEVAQVARSIAECLKYKNENDTGKAALDALGGLDPDAAAAAALAHDLGHPPYGHLGEDELDKGVRLVTNREGDGFEGNAQSFRIITKLSMRRENQDGLDLTCAVLNGVLKYPWMWADRPPEYPGKWGAYEEERELYDWARSCWGRGNQEQCLEAAVMDWADDITYALHDVEDFFRAGLIPLDVLSRKDRSGESGREHFVNGIWTRNGGSWREKTKDEALALAERTFVGNDLLCQIESPYDGSPALKRILKTWTSRRIKEYVDAPALGVADKKALAIDDDTKSEVALLKELTWQYVIFGPELSTQRIGQRRIIKDIFTMAFDAIVDRKSWGTLPQGQQQVLAEAFDKRVPGVSDVDLSARLAADFVAGLTEQQAVILHRRITGIDVGPVFDAML